MDRIRRNVEEKYTLKIEHVCLHYLAVSSVAAYFPDGLSSFGPCLAVAALLAEVFDYQIIAVYIRCILHFGVRKTLPN